MRPRHCVSPLRSPVSWLVSSLLLLLGMSLSTTPGSAANVIVKDGNTIQLAEITYRLDGIDAPELDQICIDDHADPWACGVDARNQLARQVGGHIVRCEDHGPDPVYSKRHLGICTLEGEMASLNQLAIGQGFAMNSATGGFGADETAAKADRKGIGKAVLSRRPISASARKTARCSVVPALPTRIVRYVRCCFRNTRRCRPAAPSRPNSRYALASPDTSASTTCRGAAAIRR